MKRTTVGTRLDSKLGYLTFDLGENFLAIALPLVKEILPMVALDQPPSRPSVLEGLLSIGSFVHPVLRLDRILGLTAAEFGVDSHLVLLKGEAPFLLLVNRVREVHFVDPGELNSSGVRSFNDCVSTQVRISGRLTPVLAPENLLIAQEKRIIEEFTSASRKRWLGLAKAAG